MNFREATIELIPYADDRFPPLLREIPNPPRALYLLGAFADFSQPHVAIVGTRRATPQGLAFAQSLAQRLTELGAVVVSGLALGLDAAAHKGALMGKGQTLAVLGNGLDTIYPRHNTALAQRILEQRGGILSEYPPSTPAHAHHFLARNRIVSGLCVATVIIEAPLYSGSLVTARCAAEQGREVFVIPGSIHHPNYQGSHALLRDGAQLVASIEDILSDLNLTSLASLPPHLTDPREQEIFAALQSASAPLSIDKLVHATTLEPHILTATLTFMITRGIIQETPRGYTL